MMTKYRRIKNGRIIIKTYALGTLYVKKEFESSKGKFYLVACRHEPGKKTYAEIIYYVIYGFDKDTGVIDFHEEFKNKNSYRDAFRCLNRYIKTICSN